MEGGEESAGVKMTPSAPTITSRQNRERRDRDAEARQYTYPPPSSPQRGAADRRTRRHARAQRNGE